MEIQEFVRESLLQIMQGVADAGEKWASKTRLSKTGGVVNPPTDTGETGACIEVDGGLAPIHPVEFDLSVLVSESASKEGNAKLTVFGQGVGGGGAKGSERTETSRIKFVVNLALPHGKLKE